MKHIEDAISKAYEVAQKMTENVGMNIDLIRNNLFDIQQSSQIAKELLKLNSLTEEEVLIVDDKDSDDGQELEGNDDQERGGCEEDDEEEHDIEEDDVEEDDDDDDEEDDEEELNKSNSNYISSHNTSKPTSSFENLQATSYSGAYQRSALYLNFQ